MEYIGENIWKFIFETNVPEWVKGIFLLCILIFVLVIVFLVAFVTEKGKSLGGKSKNL